MARFNSFRLATADLNNPNPITKHPAASHLTPTFHPRSLATPPPPPRHSSSQSIRPRKGHDARDDKEQGGPTVDCESEQEGEGVRDREEVGERGDPCDG